MPGTKTFVIAALLFVVFVVAFMARPTPILGTDADLLAASVNGGSSPIGCKDRSGDAWVCYVWDNEMSGAVSYRVEMKDLGCWDGTRIGPGAAGGRAPPEKSGCVSLVDHLEAMLP